MTRPRCLDRCNSPIACAGWGYCRDRNKNGVPKSEKVIRAWQEMDWPEQFVVEVDNPFSFADAPRQESLIDQFKEKGLNDD